RRNRAAAYSRHAEGNGLEQEPDRRNSRSRAVDARPQDQAVRTSAAACPRSGVDRRLTGNSRCREGGGSATMAVNQESVGKEVHSMTTRETVRPTRRVDQASASISSGSQTGKLRSTIVIPARLASTRLPHKLLLSETGIPLLQHTYEAACRANRPTGVIV